MPNVFRFEIGLLNENKPLYSEKGFHIIIYSATFGRSHRCIDTFKPRDMQDGFSAKLDGRDSSWREMKERCPGVFHAWETVTTFCLTCWSELAFRTPPCWDSRWAVELPELWKPFTTITHKICLCLLSDETCYKPRPLNGFKNSNAAYHKEIIKLLQYFRYKVILDTILLLLYQLFNGTLRNLRRITNVVQWVC